MNDRVELLWRSNSCLKHTFTPKSCQASFFCRSSSRSPNAGNWKSPRLHVSHGRC